MQRITPIRIGDFGLPKKRKPIKKKKPKSIIKRRTFTADFNYLMKKQGGWCANKGCAKLNRVKQKVTSLKDLDHKFPVRLWELTGKKGNVNTRSNLQLLCPNCHRYKNAEDRKKIALHQDRHKARKQKKKPTKRKPRQPSLFSGLPKGLR